MAYLYLTLVFQIVHELAAFGVGVGAVALQLSRAVV